MTKRTIETEAPTVDLAMRLGYRIARYPGGPYSVELCGRPVVPGLVVDRYDEALALILGAIDGAPEA